MEISRVPLISKGAIAIVAIERYAGDLPLVAQEKLLLRKRMREGERQEVSELKRDRGKEEG